MADSGSKSSLKSTEVAFPRGGTSGLTPLEVKEISNEATKDVLFETNKRKTNNDDTGSSKKRKSKSKSSKTDDDDDDDDENSVKIENFNFKTLIPGTKVIGEITGIKKFDLTVALGDNLVGFVPINSISEEISQQIENYVEHEEDASDEESDDDINYADEDKETDEHQQIKTGTLKDNSVEFPNLNSIFQIGQWVNAQVVEPSKDNHKKRIQLTLEPEVINKDLEVDDLIPGNMIQGSIKSIEDHGVILSIGKSNMTGFISNKNLPQSMTYSPGKIIFTSIASKSVRALTLKTVENAKSTAVSTISSVDAIQTGTLVNALVSKVSKNGVICKVFGLVDGTINLPHTNQFDYKQLEHKYGVGNTIKTRIIAILTKAGTKKLILSQLPHIMSFQSIPEIKQKALDAFPIGYRFDSVTIKGVDPNYIYVDIVGGFTGQIHNSKIDQSKSLDIEYSVGSSHSARIIGFNSIDNVFILSMEPAVVNATYLNINDIPDGELFKDVEIVKVLPDSKGITVKVNGFDAFVPPNHISDVRLIYPERKFKIGSKVKGRVVKKQGRTLLVSLKKSLVNAEGDSILTKFEDAEIGLKTPATVEKFIFNGVLVSFFGNLAAYLPKVEISETFVHEAKDYLKIGQTVNVRIKEIKQAEKRLVVTLKQSTDLSAEQKDSINQLVAGKTFVDVVVTEKAKDSIIIETLENNLRGVIYNGHLSDGNYEQNRALYKQLQIGSKYKVLVLETDLKARTFIATNKKSLQDAAVAGDFPSSFKDIKLDDKILHGYVKSVTSMGLFVAFGGKLTGLVLAKYAVDKKNDDLSKKFFKYQTIACHVIRIDEENKRFLLSIKDVNNNSSDTNGEEIFNPVDSSMKTTRDYQPGVNTKAMIKSVKGTQLNVQLADNLQGRIDITNCFNSWDEIKDPHQPLSQFHKNEVFPVKIIGYHDSKNHKFLPITHRKPNKHIILELSLTKDDEKEPLSLSNIAIGSEHVVYINNIAKGYVWISLTPSVRGRISFMELTNDASIFEDLDNKLPIGTALKSTVKEVDHEHNVVIMSSRKPISSYEDVKVDGKYPARVLKVKDTFVLVELGEGVVASSFITDALNDYSDKLESVFHVNDYTTATVVAKHDDTKKISVSLRNDDAKDKMINSYEDVKKNDVVNGFVKNVADNGVYVSLGRSTHALVKIADLSDSYLKDWKKYFKPHQLVTGKISHCGGEGQIKMTLKESQIHGELKTLKGFDDLNVGDIYEGSVRNVTDFGVFVKLDGTFNISGLCHQSQISDNDISDLQQLFGEGDRVKVKVLKINPEKKQLSLGMKASYFTEDVPMEDAEEEEEAENEVEEEEEDDDDDDEEDDDEDEDDVNEVNEELMEVDDSDEEEESDDNEEPETAQGLSTNGFDWTASILDQAEESSSSDDEEEDVSDKKKKKRSSKDKYAEDKTGDINTRAPQSNNDFERLIVGNPNSSILWVNYMSFQLQLSEVDKAREIGDRALKTIKYTEEAEKLNIWIALLNLENSFGSEESLEDVFKKSCQYMDALTMHQKLAAIFVMSENFDKVDDIYKKMLKKFGLDNVTIWVNYGANLMDRSMFTESHEILSKALQALPKRDHIEVVKKFAQLEFEKGESEQGRSLFEGLISDAPKKIDLWNVYIDKEIKFGKDKSKVEDLFERVITKKLTKKQAKFFFNKWVDYENECDDEKGAIRVKAKATEYAQALTN